MSYMYLCPKSGDPVLILYWVFKSANSFGRIKHSRVPTKEQKVILLSDENSLRNLG